MDETMTTVLHCVMPVFNEEINIGRVLRDLAGLQRAVASEFACRAVLVDDGSMDNTVAAARAAGADLGLTVLRHDRNQGPGAAFATAFAYLRDRLRPGDWAVTLEADNTSSVETLKQMLVRRKEGYEAVLASPYSYGGGFSQSSLFRVALSSAGNALVKSLLKLRGINTFSSFFRIYSAVLLERLYRCFGPGILELSGFECMVELLFKMVLVQARISEVETTVDWSRRGGKSKMPIVRTAFGYIRILARRNDWIRLVSRSGCARG